MAQVIKRQPDVHASRSLTMENVGTKPSVSTPSKSPASQAHLGPDEGKANPSSPSGSRWTSAFEEPAVARVQQFIIDTLKNPIRFLKSDLPVAQQVPYEPINDPKLIAERKEGRAKSIAKPEIPASPVGERSGKSSDQSTLSANGTTSPSKQVPDLFSHKLSLRSSKMVNERGAGLNNRGNTCYMNSTLQALLHLPPLTNALLMLDSDQLYGRYGTHPQAPKFDAIHEMKALATRSLTVPNPGPTSPNAFIANLKSYARTLVKFRQEDAHEFLRFLLDAMQFCCLARAPKSLKPFDPLRETTLVHKIFGGKLRSRVHCLRCKHNSDTYDPILDLSLDIRNLSNSSLHSALDSFTGVDQLRGSEKYRCESCKGTVNATKQFTIHQAPTVLTIHLKRFTLSGQKISKQVSFGEDLILTKQVLSEGQAPQKYRLHAVVHHQGGGPNSGHYIASVRGSSGRWYEMNDSHVSPMRGPPVNSPHAYILFYVRASGSALGDALRPHEIHLPQASSSNKRSREDAEGEGQHQRVKLSSNGQSSFKQNGRPSPHIRSTNGFASRNGEMDGDDIGEAVNGTPLRDANSSSYESLFGESGSRHSSGSPSTFAGSPMSKKERRRMREAMQRRDGAESNGTLGTKTSGAQPVRGAQSLVRSPYATGRSSLNTRFDGNRNRDSRFDGSRGGEGGRLRNRMKDKQGKKVGV